MDHHFVFEQIFEAAFSMEPPSSQASRSSTIVQQVTEEYLSGMFKSAKLDACMGVMICIALMHSHTVSVAEVRDGVALKIRSISALHICRKVSRQSVVL